MQLTIDGKTVIPREGQSLRELVAQLGLDSPSLSRRPLAARIAGEVFTLNYVPLRQQEGNEYTIAGIPTKAIILYQLW